MGLTLGDSVEHCPRRLVQDSDFFPICFDGQMLDLTVETLIVSFNETIVVAPDSL